ncbi:MAG: hypothetical protein KBT36_17175 [Kurthia sp.]|nr:hypothetical protein [Candidatus Kurthia equi]
MKTFELKVSDEIKKDIPGILLLWESNDWEAVKLGLTYTMQIIQELGLSRETDAVGFYRDHYNTRAFKCVEFRIYHDQCFDNFAKNIVHNGYSRTDYDIYLFLTHLLSDEIKIVFRHE